MENVKLRRELEKAILLALIEEAAVDGWTPNEVDDGGEESVPVGNIEQCVEAVFAVDEAEVFFTKQEDGNTRHTWVRLIGGNGEDFLSDYGINFDPVCARVYERIKEVTVVLPRKEGA